jgi:hypothetical protein
MELSKVGFQHEWDPLNFRHSGSISAHGWLAASKQLTVLYSYHHEGLLLREDVVDPT